ncbi:MAG: hypothetical protein KF850_17680 [Labilithrix sp.]|nr:hypothetical protein [Labilithrix sp.]
MTLPRLTDDPAKARFASMLRKAREESLSPAAERRIAAAVLAPSEAIATARPTSRRALVTKGALGLSALALVTAFAVSRSEAPRSEAPTADPPGVRRDEVGAVAAPEPAPSGDVAALSVHDLPTAAPPASAGRPASADAPAPEADDLGAEAAFLRSVREDIAAGRGQEALRKLARYDERFRGRGAMGEEAAVERVEALLQVGRAREADALATRLLAERPNGPFARKLRSLLSRPEPLGAPSPAAERDSQP